MKQIILGSLSGDGVVTGLTGKAEAFSVEFFGQWSIANDALHLDETVTFGDGRQERRNWAIQLDERGRLVGYDTDRRTRVHAHVGADRVRLVYSAPLGGGAEIAGPRTVIDLVQKEDGSVHMESRAAVLGLPYQRSHAVLHRPAA